MSDRNCAIKNCPALAANGSTWCAAHRTLTPEQRREEQEDAERRQFNAHPMRPVTDRIEHEKKP